MLGVASQLPRRRGAVSLGEAEAVGVHWAAETLTRGSLLCALRTPRPTCDAARPVSPYGAACTVPRGGGAPYPANPNPLTYAAA
ncbi:hypothetical protein ScoT_14650 [Streptomyces albidoflavus]|uniref:Uncharacterized protein n=1 Tax=Streptomyces albidoflavus TaxID=1886 RepID=A0AA37FAX7_9ACTN|nr:hypothetical protein ScoT_14650 [Streptomyces albidoflavus]